MDLIAPERTGTERRGLRERAVEDDAVVWSREVGLTRVPQESSNRGSPRRGKVPLKEGSCLSEPCLDPKGIAPGGQLGKPQPIEAGILCRRPIRLGYHRLWGMRAFWQIRDRFQHQRSEFATPAVVIAG